MEGKDFEVEESGFVKVHASGACVDSGTPGAKAGIGIWFCEGSCFNVSAPVVGPADNNIAEIQAVTKAAQVVDDAGITKLRVYTDSENVVKCYTELIPEWNRNGWITDSGSPVVHKADLQKMESILNRLTVDLQHVKGDKKPTATKKQISLRARARSSTNRSSTFSPSA